MKQFEKLKEDLFEDLENYGNRNGTEAQCDKAEELLKVALSCMDNTSKKLFIASDPCAMCQDLPF